MEIQFILGSDVSLAAPRWAVGPDGTLYAGGEFTNAGGMVVANIAKLSGDPAKFQSARFVNLLHAAGLLTIPAGANVIRLLPALNLRHSEAEEGIGEPYGYAVTVIIDGIRAASIAVPGRRLVEGADSVTIHGEKVAVAAEVHTLGGFSAHAGQTDLLKWFSVIAPSKPRVILTHGEDEPRAALAKKIQQRFRLPSTLPRMMETVEL